MINTKLSQDDKNKNWQKHVLTLNGREILAQVLIGEIAQEIPSAYIAYIPELETMEVEQYPTYLAAINEIPSINKRVDIISKISEADKSIITVQVSNTGIEESFRYNCIFVTSKTKDKRIVPYTISAIKEVQLLSTDIPLQLQFDLATIISTDAVVNISVSPFTSASGVQFDGTSIDIEATNVQEAIEETIKLIKSQNEALSNHEKKKVASTEGVHGFKVENNELYAYTNSQWENIDVTAKHRGVRVIGGDGVHGIKFDTSDKRLKYKNNSNNWENIPTGQEEIDEHVKIKVNSVEGVHGFRYNTTNETLEVESEEGQWTEVGGGLAGALLSPVTNIKVKAGNTKLTVSWTDSIEGTWAGTKLVYKVGSYPENPKDGTLAVDNKVKDQYKDTGFDINALNNGTKYYFMFFPYDAKNKYNLNMDNRTIGVPQAFRSMTVIRDKNNSNSETCLTYGDDATSMTPKSDDWDSFFGHFPCLFKNGEIVGRLNRQDRTKFEDGRPADITSGNEGDVMIAFPKRKLKIITSGSNIHVSMTDNLDADSSFEDNAHIRGINPKNYFFVGAYAGSVIDGKLRSLNGKTPTTNMTISQARSYARANGTGYDQLAIYQLTYLQSMYLLKYKNLNSQQAVGRGYVDGNSAVLNTGGTETKGMDWGETTGKQHMVLFGLEDFWGNVFQWIDGLYYDAQRNILTATDKFNDTGAGYTNQGKGANANIGGYISDVQGGTKTGFIAKTCSGSETTHYADYGYLSASCLPYFGGSWAHGSTAGAFDLHVYYSASYSYSYLGARLMYL